jgi:hypothetical protein
MVMDHELWAVAQPPTRGREVKGKQLLLAADEVSRRESARIENRFSSNDARTREESEDRMAWVVGRALQRSVLHALTCRV